jgi:hypothetical protein
MNKYKSVKTKYNGITFHSKKEANYAKLLDMLKKASDPKSRVVSYEIQVPYEIYINDQKICRYLADFKVKYADGRIEVVDVKGFRTSLYKLKKKLVEAQYGIKIIEY